MTHSRADVRVVRHDAHRQATAPAAVFSHVITVETESFRVVEVSGQMAVDADATVVAPEHAAEQSRVVFDLLDRLLAEQGTSFADDVVRLRAHLASMDDAIADGRELAPRVSGHPPASTMVEVARLFRPGAVVEVDVTAWCAGSASDDGTDVRLADR